jgi:hypothetical protein
MESWLTQAGRFCWTDLRFLSFQGYLQLSANLVAIDVICALRLSFWVEAFATPSTQQFSYNPNSTSWQGYNFTGGRASRSKMVSDTD